MSEAALRSVDPAGGLQRVGLSALKLSQFRNYAALTLRLGPEPVVLTGPNGAGKTNLLEAVSFLSPGRGLRRARLPEVARHPGDGSWAVAATLSGPHGDTEIGTGITLSADGPERQRSVRINRAPAQNSRALLDLCRVAWLTPAMDGLFTGPASDRRRFLDRLVLALDPLHGDRVGAYERAMRSRNRLFDEGRSDDRWFAAIEAQMAELAVAIAAARRECVALLAGAIAAQPVDGPFPAARVTVDGTVEALLEGATATEAEDRTRDGLAAGRLADRLAGRTRSGPHLSDLVVVHGPKAAATAECSTGEQKALLVGIVLAHARLTAQLTGTTPVILLDEIAAHLDASRRAALFGILLDLGAQVWMTGTESAPFGPLRDRAQFFRIEDAVVTHTAPS